MKGTWIKANIGGVQRKETPSVVARFQYIS